MKRAKYGQAILILSAFGIVWLLICAVLLALPYRLLQLTIIGSIFEGSAVLTIGGGDGSTPLVPALVSGLLAIGILSTQFLLGARRVGLPTIRRVVTPLILAWIYGILTGYFIPRIFAGAVDVWPQRLAAGTFQPIPLAPSRGNLTQAIYLTVYVAVVMLTSVVVARRRGLGPTLVRTYLVSGYLVVAIALWQFVHNITGLYYPSDFLYSNTSWAIFPGQIFGRVTRLNGPFTEPSSLAIYMTSVAFSCFWLIMSGYRGALVSPLLALSVLVTLLSTSTTGIIALSLGLPAVFLAKVWRASPIGLRRLVLGWACGLALLLLGALFLPATAPDFAGSIVSVIEGTLQKESTESYEIRSRQDADSLAVGFQTYGFGAGWGSVRASSFLPNLVGNVGFLGLTLVLWFAASLAHLGMWARQRAKDVEQVFVLDAATGALAGELAGSLVAGPQIESMSFYVLAGTLIGCAARVASEWRANSSGPLPGHRAAASRVTRGLAKSANSTETCTNSRSN